jgi:FixJ family two-component response regulator
MIRAPIISIVDDDESVRDSLPDLLKEFGFVARVFASAEEFLEFGDLDATGCLVLDIAMPGMSGPELQQELKRRRRTIPIIFITAHGDETVRPVMLALGAIDCLFKPFTDLALLGALRAALRTA